MRSNNNDPRVIQTGMRISEHLTKIESLFTGDFKVTLIVRFPGFPEQEMVVTSDDDPDELIKVIERTKARTIAETKT